MCSFGYVLTDEDFRILKKEDILINPEAGFCTRAWSKKKREEGRGITLAYPEKVFRKSPTFPKVYEKIRDILEKDGQTIIGFSHANDVRYLCTACRRYKLPFFSYSFHIVINGITNCSHKKASHSSCHLLIDNRFVYLRSNNSQCHCCSSC